MSEHIEKFLRRNIQQGGMSRRVAEHFENLVTRIEKRAGRKASETDMLGIKVFLHGKQEQAKGK